MRWLNRAEAEKTKGKEIWTERSRNQMHPGSGKEKQTSRHWHRDRERAWRTRRARRTQTRWAARTWKRPKRTDFGNQLFCIRTRRDFSKTLPGFLYIIEPSEKVKPQTKTDRTWCVFQHVMCTKVCILLAKWGHFWGVRTFWMVLTVEVELWF